MRRLRVAASFVLLATTACSGAEAGDDAARRARDTGFRGVLLEEPIAGIDFTLTDTNGQPFRFREQSAGHVTLLFFGYANCPDVCPVHMANLGEVLAKFPHAERSRVKVVFVTTDPERDTPERLRAWLDKFDTRFIGLTGELDEVNRIQNALGLPAAIRDNSTVGADKYLVGHAAQVLAFTPDGIGRLAYPFGTRQEDWMHDLPRLLNYSQQSTVESRKLKVKSVLRGSEPS